MELPKRNETIEVEVRKNCVAVMRTLTSRELASIWERSNAEVAATETETPNMAERRVELRASLAEMVMAFETHVVAFKGTDAPTFDGEQFKAGNEDHLARLPGAWKVAGGSELISDAMLVGAVRGN